MDAYPGSVPLASASGAAPAVITGLLPLPVGPFNPRRSSKFELAAGLAVVS